MKKVRPSEQKCKELEGLLESEALEMIEDFHRVGQEKLYQEALEAEVDAHLGRAWYKRGILRLLLSSRTGVQTLRSKRRTWSFWLPILNLSNVLRNVDAAHLPTRLGQTTAACGSRHS